MSPKIRAIEEREGKPITEIIKDAFQDHDSVSAVARSLNVPQPTLWHWMKWLGLKTKTIVVEEHTGGTMTQAH